MLRLEVLRWVVLDHLNRGWYPDGISEGFLCLRRLRVSMECNFLEAFSFFLGAISKLGSLDQMSTISTRSEFLLEDVAPHGSYLHSQHRRRYAENIPTSHFPR